MQNTGGVYFLAFYWGSPLLNVFPTEMVTGGTYDIKIRVKSGILKVYIDGGLKATITLRRIVAEASDQEIYAVSEWSPGWIDGELSNVRYFAIGDSCSALDNTGISDINDNGSCDCLDGFSGATCQDVETPVDPCNPCMNGGVFVESEPAAECSQFHSASDSVVNIGKQGALATVSIPADFELSFTLLMNQPNEYYSDQDIINIRHPDIVTAQQPRVSMSCNLNSNNEPIHFLIVNWNQEGLGPWAQQISFPTEMVSGGTYNIKIRVNYNYMKIYIDGCLKGELGVDVFEVEDQAIFAVSGYSPGWIDGAGA